MHTEYKSFSRLEINLNTLIYSDFLIESQEFSILRTNLNTIDNKRESLSQQAIENDEIAEEFQFQDNHLEISSISLNHHDESKNIKTNLLHQHADFAMPKFCSKLLHISRKANVCKSHSSEILRLIGTALSQPNNMPRSIPSLLQTIEGN